MRKKPINYIKMHGLGNDFVIIDYNEMLNCNDIPAFAQHITNRRLGIGADQFIIYKKQASYYEMTIYNHDGSPAANCGNAARCLAKLMFMHFNQREITLKIVDRELKCTVVSKDAIRVNMGRPSFDARWIPQNNVLWEFASRYTIAPKEIICVEISNTHLVIFRDLSVQDKEIIGNKLQAKTLFPDGVNVNFATIKGDKIYLQVFERGTGFTLACGSGACASFAAAIKLGFITKEAEVVFELGSLHMQCENEDIIMEGPATLVSEGQFYYE